MTYFVILLLSAHFLVLLWSAVQIYTEFYHHRCGRCLERVVLSKAKYIVLHELHFPKGRLETFPIDNWGGTCATGCYMILPLDRVYVVKQFVFHNEVDEQLEWKP